MHKKLKSLIMEKIGSISRFARKCGWSYPTAFNKVNGNREFTVSDIETACKVLEIRKADIPKFFFDNHGC